MNRENSVYTIIYAAVMVILVALGLAFTHQVLNDQQIANENTDKMQQILRSLNMNVSAAEAQAKYAGLIKNAYLIDENGVKMDGTDGITPNDPAFSTELGSADAKGLPVYEAEVDGDIKYIIPMTGAGLWGPIWGYLAIERDGSSIYGSEFGHAAETPGLGAEIETAPFRSQFVGKKLFRENEFTSVAVVKPGQTNARRDYVDGISGGTITSKGVDDMLLHSVGRYENFLVNLRAVN